MNPVACGSQSTISGNKIISTSPRNMNDIELILTMLAEATTTTLHRDRDSQGMKPLKKDAKDGGAVAGRTRKDIERQTSKPVISTENFKKLTGRQPKKLKAGED